MIETEEKRKEGRNWRKRRDGEQGGEGDSCSKAADWIAASAALMDNKTE